MKRDSCRATIEFQYGECFASDEELLRQTLECMTEEDRYFRHLHTEVIEYDPINTNVDRYFHFKVSWDSEQLCLDLYDIQRALKQDVWWGNPQFRIEVSPVIKEVNHFPFLTSLFSKNE